MRARRTSKPLCTCPRRPLTICVAIQVVVSLLLLSLFRRNESPRSWSSSIDSQISIPIKRVIVPPIPKPLPTIFNPSSKLLQQYIQDATRYYQTRRTTFNFEKPATAWKTDILLRYLHSPQNFDTIKTLGILDVGANRGQMIRHFPWLDRKEMPFERASFVLIEGNPGTVRNELIPRVERALPPLKANHSQTNVEVECLNFAMGPPWLLWRNISFDGEDEGEYTEHAHIAIDPKQQVFKKRHWVTLETVDDLLINYTSGKCRYCEHIIDSDFRMLKIDTEGFDAWVVFGANLTLSFFDVVFYECSNKQTEADRPNTSWKELAEFWRDRGFWSFRVGMPASVRLDAEVYSSMWDNRGSMDWQNCMAFNSNSKHGRAIHNLTRVEPDTDVQYFKKRLVVGDVGAMSNN